jgi:hypothetical protein
MTEEDVEVLEKLIDGMVSEVSRIALLSFRGFKGSIGIREDLYKVETSVISTITFYLDTEKTYSLSPIAKAVSESRNIIEANMKLNKMGIRTEFDLELEAQRRRARSYRELFEDKYKNG